MTEYTEIDRSTWEVIAEAIDKVQESTEVITKMFELDPTTTKLRTASYRKAFILHNLQGYDIVLFFDGSAVIYHPNKVVCYVLQYGRITRLYVEEGTKHSYTIASVEKAIAGAESLYEFFRMLELQ